jgi:hypothetical protein
MDTLSKFLHNIAYKFPKGYPDMNNAQDILILENELKKMGIKIQLNEDKQSFENLSPQSQKVALDISDKLKIPKENIIKDTSKRIIILTDESRPGIIRKLVDLGFEKDPNIKGSSIGGVRSPEGIEVIIKPLSKQGGASSGKQNEKDFESLINNKIAEYGSPITVILKSTNGKSIKTPNVSKAEDVSKENVAEFNKSDIQLLDPSNKVVANISLKKRNAIRWESSKTRSIGNINIFKSFIDKVGKIGTDDEVGKFENVVLYPLERQGKYKLYDPINDKILSKVIIIGIPENVWKNMIFGNDVPKTIVVKEDFEDGYNDYTFEEGILTLNCQTIYTDAEDVKDTFDEPIFALSNHIGQSYGVEFRSFSKGALYDNDELKGSSTEISFSDLK